MNNAQPRMMCVELAPDEAERQFRMQAFPFLMGLGRSRGWRVSWHALGVPYDPKLRYALGPRDLRRLLAEARRRRPLVILCNERLIDGQIAALAAASGGARVVYCPLAEGWIQEFPEFVRREIPEFGGPPSPQWLRDLAPVFERETLNDFHGVADPLIRVVAGTRCSYRTRAADNPFFRGLDLPSATMPCSFCDMEPHENPVRAPVAFAVRQVAAACRQLPGETIERRFELIGSGIWRRLEEFVRALSRAGVRGAELSFMPRLDEILDARDSIERCMPLLAEGGLSMRLYGAGVENFSAEENMRLNKGITAKQVHEAAAFISAARLRWPREFRFKDGALSMILFTPWTTLEDLRVNIENIERCPLICPFFALGRRLQIFPGAGRPVRLLAERDGLVEASRTDSFYNSGCIVDAAQREIPWRFAHPEVEILCRLGLEIFRLRKIVRGGPGNGQALDPDRRAIVALLRGSTTPLPLFRRAIDAVERRPRIDSMKGLLVTLLTDARNSPCSR